MIYIYKTVDYIEFKSHKFYTFNYKNPDSLPIVIEESEDENSDWRLHRYCGDMNKLLDPIIEEE